MAAEAGVEEAILEELRNQIESITEERKAEELQETSEVVQNTDQLQERGIAQEEMEPHRVNSDMQLSQAQNEEVDEQDESKITQTNQNESHDVEVSLGLLGQKFIHEMKEKIIDMEMIASGGETNAAEAIMIDEAEARMNVDKEQKRTEEHNEFNEMKQEKQTIVDNMQVDACHGTLTEHTPDNVLEDDKCQEKFENSNNEIPEKIIMSEIGVSIEEAAAEPPEKTQVPQEEGEEVVTAEETIARIITEDPSSVPYCEDEKDEGGIEKPEGDIPVTVCKKQEGSTNSVAEEQNNQTKDFDNNKKDDVNREKMESENLKIAPDLVHEDKMQQSVNELEVEGTHNFTNDVNHNDMGIVYMNEEVGSSSFTQNPLEENTLGAAILEESDKNIYDETLVELALEDTHETTEANKRIEGFVSTDELAYKNDKSEKEHENTEAEVLETTILAEINSSTRELVEEKDLPNQQEESFEEKAKIWTPQEEALVGSNIAKASDSREDEDEKISDVIHVNINTEPTRDNDKDENNSISDVPDTDGLVGQHIQAVNNNQEIVLDFKCKEQIEEASHTKESTVADNNIEEACQKLESISELVHQSKTPEGTSEVMMSQNSKNDANLSVDIIDASEITENKELAKMEQPQVSKGKVHILAHTEASIIQKDQLPRQEDSAVEEENHDNLEVTFELEKNKDQCQKRDVLDEMGLHSVESDMQIFNTKNEEVNDQDEADDNHMQMNQNECHDVEVSSEVIVHKVVLEDKTDDAEARMNLDEENKKYNQANELIQRKEASEDNMQASEIHDVNNDQETAIAIQEDSISYVAHEQINQTKDTDDNKKDEACKETVEYEKIELTTDMEHENQMQQSESDDNFNNMKNKVTVGISSNEEQKADEEFNKENELKQGEEIIKEDMISDVFHVNDHKEPTRENDEDMNNSISDVPGTDQLVGQYIQGANNNQAIVLDSECKDSTVEESCQKLESISELVHQSITHKGTSELMSENSENHASLSPEIVDASEIIENKESRIEQPQVSQGNIDILADTEAPIIQKDQLPKEEDSTMEERNSENLQEIFELVQKTDQFQEKVALNEMELHTVKSDVQIIHTQNEEVNDQDKADDKYTQKNQNGNHDTDVSSYMEVQKVIYEETEKNRSKIMITLEDETDEAGARMNLDEEKKKYNEDNELKQEKQASEENMQLKTCDETPTNQTLDDVQEKEVCKANVEVSSIETPDKIFKYEIGTSIVEVAAAAEKEHSEKSELPQVDEAFLTFEREVTRTNTEDPSSIPDFEDEKVPEMASIYHDNETTKVMDGGNLEQNVEAAPTGDIPISQSIHDQVAKETEETLNCVAEELIHQTTTTQDNIDIDTYKGSTEAEKLFISNSVKEDCNYKSEEIDLDKLRKDDTTQVYEIHDRENDQETAKAKDDNILENNMEDDSNKYEMVVDGLIQKNELDANLDKNIGTSLMPKKFIEETVQTRNEMHEDDNDSVSENMGLIEQDLVSKSLEELYKAFSGEQNHEAIADTEITDMNTIQINIAEVTSEAHKNVSREDNETTETALLENENRKEQEVDKCLLSNKTKNEEEEERNYLNPPEVKVSGKIYTNECIEDRTQEKKIKGSGSQDESVKDVETENVLNIFYAMDEINKENKSVVDAENNEDQEVETRLESEEDEDKAEDNIQPDMIVYEAATTSEYNEENIKEKTTVKSVSESQKLEDVEAKNPIYMVPDELEIADKDTHTDEERQGEQPNRADLEENFEKVKDRARKAVEEVGLFSSNEQIHTCDATDNLSPQEQDYPRKVMKRQQQSDMVVDGLKIEDPNVKNENIIADDNNVLDPEVSDVKDAANEHIRENNDESNDTEPKDMLEAKRSVTIPQQSQKQTINNSDNISSDQGPIIMDPSEKRGTTTLIDEEETDGSFVIIETDGEVIKYGDKDLDEVSEFLIRESAEDERPERNTNDDSPASKVGGNVYEDFSKADSLHHDEKIQTSIIGKTSGIPMHEDKENKMDIFSKEGGIEDMRIFKGVEKIDQDSNALLHEQLAFTSEPDEDAKILDNGEKSQLNLQTDEIGKYDSLIIDNTIEGTKIQSKGVKIESSRENQDAINELQIQNVKSDLNEQYMSFDSHEVQKLDTFVKSTDKVVQEEMSPKVLMDERQTNKRTDTHLDDDKTDEENDEKEEEDDHKIMESIHDSTIPVEARDAVLKPAHKKSHNILSGVGSKVKRLSNVEELLA
ncbi:hypothetical protein MUK42_28056 [Musa troglodytarum]|uniref:Uncharacterized protein n=1 Tax=Musa troglodytarum TaxID=320322 RepID=A0A9E7F187_9LILI|nr:hypothetical protein MUK42_28056 [Musa troglodytarum]